MRLKAVSQRSVFSLLAGVLPWCTLACLAQQTHTIEGAAGGYTGVSLQVPGIYLTPVPNAPFSAVEHLVTHQKAADGSDRVLQTTTHIARSSSGMTYTERRSLLPAGDTQEPRLQEGQLYDPTSQRSTLFDPATRIARQMTLPRPRPLRAGPTEPSPHPVLGVTEQDLGTQTQEGLELHGLRRTRVLPAPVSGTGAPVNLVDEYWYSPALAVYVLLRHEDPRTGEQLIALSGISRSEPASTQFRVPDVYKIVDETPPPPPPPVVLENRAKP